MFEPAEKGFMIRARTRIRLGRGRPGEGAWVDVGAAEVSWGGEEAIS